ncbi:Glutaredoxin [Penicillium brevicompactum]|uniref:Glutaredoxin n=1 Tax=Penicillium brevicompactum TaxID=5074 RepID=UPI00253FEE60|nr:Glutaredoxin [Penicillium brevicompactum]KAJ5321941.1 Glutaredoxin [Penicillium brevicompactum]
MPDSTLYLYTSLTAGSSHIITATSRIETILKANKLPFRAIDVATDEAARKLWGRRSRGKKLPGLVKYGDIVGDLEEVEEWNEFGELRMVVNSVQDLGGMPATSNPLPATETKTEPKATTPKPSTIKIQTPPVTSDEDKKDDMTVLALRQASTEAASKAKAKAEDKKIPAKEEPKDEVPLAGRGHRGSVACELPDTAPDSPQVKRPTLVPENAAVSSANFHVDNAEMLGLVGHHRGSRVPTLENPEQDEVVHELRKSISQESTGNLDAIRKEAAQKTQAGSPIEEVPTPLVDDAIVTETKAEPTEPNELKEPNEPQGQAIAEIIAKAVEEPREAQEEIKKTQEAVEASSPKGTEIKDGKENTQPIPAQVPKSAE